MTKRTIKTGILIVTGLVALAMPRARAAGEADTANDWLQQIWMNTASEGVRKGEGNTGDTATSTTNAGPSAAAVAVGELTPEALKADPWVTPPRNQQDMQGRMDELKRHYEPFLRSLPAKLEPRRRQELQGPWRSQFEMTHSEQGIRPPTPGWFEESFGDAAWAPTTVPEWRWSTLKRHNMGRTCWLPANCILWYRTRFAAEPPAAGQRVWLCFGGVDWEAEVWLNGTRLGSHKGYYEPFRFDVTKLLKSQNTLAVRVFDGDGYGEPYSQWSLFPFAPGDAVTNAFAPGDAGSPQRYVRDRARSIRDYAFGTTSSGGSGYGIHREVYLETTADACVTEIFARGNPQSGVAQVRIETDAAAERELEVEVQLLPENFAGAAYKKVEKMRAPQGAGQREITVPIPGAKPWWPMEPNLYRCRVSLRDGQGKLVDARDALFGVRSFTIASKRHPVAGLKAGTYLLNGRPVYLRGTGLSGIVNAYWYWGETDNLLRTLLMIKAGNFTAVRVNQHTDYPEVREIFDRLGLFSQQEQGSGYSEMTPAVLATLAETGTKLARVCFNNPGVVLLSFCNENHYDATAVVSNTLAADPERIIVPDSGGNYTLKDKRYEDNLIAGRHDYACWYGDVHALHIGVNGVWKMPYTDPPKLDSQDEYGAEALDGYETMLNYPPHWGAPPRPDADKLWGARQVDRGHALRQQHGFRGRVPTNLLQYIEASQNYQADALVETTRSFRIRPGAHNGYFQYHFIDGTAANWPKAIVGHDFRPKKAYYDMAMINQPLVPLYWLKDRGRALELWAVNNLPVAFPGARIQWKVCAGDRELKGEVPVDIRPNDAVKAGRMELAGLPDELELLQVTLTLVDAKGRTLSTYQRELYRGYRLIDQAQKAWDARFGAKPERFSPRPGNPSPRSSPPRGEEGVRRRATSSPNCAPPPL